MLRHVRDRSCAFRALALLLLLLELGAAPARAGETVLALRIGDHGDKTRLVLEMTGTPEFELTTVAEPPGAVVEFPAMAWQAEPVEGVGLIAAVHHDASEPARCRLVLELEAPVVVRDVFYLPAAAGQPYRFVLDLAPAGPGGAAAGPAIAAPLPPPLPASRRVVVAIDAGHGGEDPGAIGVTGLREKDVTLAVAERLRALLEESGRASVVMIRDGDVSISLRERVRLARQAEADLFVSLHADSIRDRDVMGASVYTLSDRASDREAEMLAARENRADALVGVPLETEDDLMVSILIDLAQHSTLADSDMLAELVVDRLGEITRLVGNTHRRAGFAVLTAPDVPSILVELGYLSNREDERRLADPEQQQSLAVAIAAAVLAYLEQAEAQHRL